METEKGVIIIAYKQAEKPRYMVLKRKKNWEGWETPKGHLENGDYEETVEIELQEEAGIDADNISEIQDMEKTVSWEYEDHGKEFRKEYKAFLVELDQDTFVDVSKNPCDEHEHGFFFVYRDAKKMITHDNNLELLEEAHQLLGN
jgi:8-oxo-dGTP pyrophosphatase MutT (NUDIX family)